MALTDAEIYKTASEHTQTIATPTRYVTGVLSFARAIEAPLLARIAELEANANVCGSGAGCLYKDARIAALTAQVEKDNWRQYATERETTAQAVIERHRGEQDSLMNLLKQAREQVEQADPMSRVAKSKLADLIAKGYRECGVMIERTDEEGTVQRGAVSNGGMVIWWHTPQIHDPQQVEQAAQPVYQVKQAFVDDPAGTWRDAGEDACYMSPETHRRVLYTAPPKAVPLTETVVYTPGKWFDATSADLMQAFFEHRLQAIREAAKEHGYAIGVHGSMRRDLDLIAAPWRDDASDADTLAHAIAMAACGIDRAGAYDWEQKPAGRLATCIPICWTHRHGVLSDGHIDLSVAPFAIPHGITPATVEKG